MEIEIRKAELTDIELLIKWRMQVLHEVFSIAKEQPLTQLEYENRIYYKEALPSGDHIACLAYINEEIIGCGGICLYKEMPSPDNPSGQCAYLMNIYTEPKFRGYGVGKKVVKWLIGQAMQRNISKIYLETSQAGKNLYKKIGFIPMQDMMKLSLSKYQKTNEI